MQAALGTLARDHRFHRPLLRCRRTIDAARSNGWAIVRRITPGIVIGGLLGAAIADVLSSRTAANHVRRIHVRDRGYSGFGILAAMASRTLPGLVGMSLAGTAIGAASSLFGVGGGSMSVPFMTWCSVAVRHSHRCPGRHRPAGIALSSDHGLHRCRLE